MESSNYTLNFNLKLYWDNTTQNKVSQICPVNCESQCKFPHAPSIQRCLTDEYFLRKSFHLRLNGEGQKMKF
jgi:hypothetical protein